MGDECIPTVAEDATAGGELVAFVNYSIMVTVTCPTPERAAPGVTVDRFIFNSFSPALLPHGDSAKFTDFVYVELWGDIVVCGVPGADAMFFATSNKARGSVIA